MSEQENKDFAHAADPAAAHVDRLARQARAAMEARAEAQGKPIVINEVKLDPRDAELFPHPPATPAAAEPPAGAEPHGDDMTV